MITPRKLSRRGVLLGFMGGTAAMLAACAAPAAPTPTTAPAKPAEAAKPAEGTKPVAAQPAAPPAAGAPIEFWIFDEFATGVSLNIMNDFIKQFESANAGTKINLIGKPSANISQGLVAGASGGALPDG